jgi:hypothetical protein
MTSACIISINLSCQNMCSTYVACCIVKQVNHLHVCMNVAPAAWSDTSPAVAHECNSASVERGFSTAAATASSLKSLAAAAAATPVAAEQRPARHPANCLEVCQQLLPRTRMLSLNYMVPLHVNIPPVCSALLQNDLERLRGRAAAAQLLLASASAAAALLLLLARADVPELSSCGLIDAIACEQQQFCMLPIKP